MRRSTPSSSAIQRAAPVLLTPAAFLAVFVIGWEVLVRVLHVPAYLVPRPSQLLNSVPADIGSHIWITAEEVALGFVVANLLAFVSAIAFAQSRTLERGLYPIAIALKTTPLVAIAPLLACGSGPVLRPRWWRPP
jgi:NitT/TauT family transport system permease protein